MGGLFELKGKLQNFYAKYSTFIDKGLQFVLALVTFFMINSNVGFISLLTNPVISIGLAVICTFLPPVVLALVAAMLILVHLYAVSLGVLAVVALVFLMMFIFYVRYTPKMAVVIILTGLAFMLKIPYVIPVACGLLASPICAVPVSFGAIGYYMIAYVKDASSSLMSAQDSSLLDEMSICIKSIFLDKEMWVTVIAFIICVLTVYAVRRLSVAHSWKIATVAGAVVMMIFIVAGDMAFGVPAPYGMLVAGNVVALIAGFVLELLFFSVDYSRSESMQYEDDEYYYYVKAVPKLSVAAEEKTVKTFTDDDDDLDVEIPKKEGKKRQNKAKRPEDRPVKRKRPPKAKSSNVPSNTEHLLLTQSLEKELKLNKKNK